MLHKTARQEKGNFTKMRPRKIFPDRPGATLLPTP